MYDPYSGATTVAVDDAEPSPVIIYGFDDGMESGTIRVDFQATGGVQVGADISWDGGSTWVETKGWAPSGTFTWTAENIDTGLLKIRIWDWDLDLQDDPPNYEGVLTVSSVRLVPTNAVRESHPSKTVFWDCDDTPEYSSILAPSENEVWLASTETPSVDVLDDGTLDETVSKGVGVEVADSSRDVAAAGTRPAAPAPALAPLVTLGQVAGDPPYSIYDIHVDHLGSWALSRF